MKNLLVLVLMLSSSLAFANNRSCTSSYIQAAIMLDQQRASCGLNGDGDKAFCRIAGRTNIPVNIQGFQFTINVAAVYRMLNNLKLLPNQMRKVAKLLHQSSSGSGKTLKRVARKVARNIPGATQEQVAQVVNALNQSGAFCSQNHLFTMKEIRLMVEDEIARQ